MKNILIALTLALAPGFAFGHEGIELGPNKGRIVEFSTDETMHGEVTQTDGKLQIALLDKDMKPVEISAQSLTATAGTREKPLKLDVAHDSKSFTFAAPESGQWLILQYKTSADAKPITARVLYNTAACAPCGQPEWRCACGEKK